jgi:FO synthase
MASAPEPALDDHLWTIAVARLIFGPQMSIQAPPNLRAGDLAPLQHAGINDWGGVSPVTPDHVNPEAPWPALDRLAAETARAGKTLAPRLTVYPGYLRDAATWLVAAVTPAALRRADGQRLAHETGWRVGRQDAGVGFELLQPKPGISSGLNTVLDRLLAGQFRSEQALISLFSARGPAAAAVCAAADALRREVCGDAVSYVVTRNINYTNVCGYRCRFCAFSKGSTAEDLRGRPYDLDPSEISRRAREAWERGATEVCMQGGIHPDYSGATYLGLCRIVKEAAPGLHLHAFSPLEVAHGARSLGLTPADFLRKIRNFGLGSLPGTAAEILDDAVCQHLCRDVLIVVVAVATAITSLF